MEEKDSLFDNIRGKLVTVNFGPHTFQSTCTGVRLAPLTNLKNKPLRKTDSLGKQYSPPCFTIEFEDGRLVFVIEDTTIIYTLDGIDIVCGKAAPVVIRKG